MTRVVLGCSGSLAAAAAIPWLRARHDADVVTLTLDVGQQDDVEQVRALALACGAARAHVVDARDRFVREAVVPALERGRLIAADASLTGLALPLVARTLAEVAAIEGADAVAHAAAGGPLTGLLAAAAPGLRVIAPAAEWGFDDGALLEYARRQHLPPVAPRRGRHLLVRPAVAPEAAPETGAHVTIAFAGGVPVAINGVAMGPEEAIDSLSLIAGHHGIGHGAAVVAPAAAVLAAAHAAGGRRDVAVRLSLRRGIVSVSGVTTFDRGTLEVSASR